MNGDQTKLTPAAIKMSWLERGGLILGVDLTFWPEYRGCHILELQIWGSSRLHSLYCVWLFTVSWSVDWCCVKEEARRRVAVNSIHHTVWRTWLYICLLRLFTIELIIDDVFRDNDYSFMITSVTITIVNSYYTLSYDWWNCFMH